MWSGARIERYTARGERDGVIDLPVRQPTSCEFAGTNLATLYVTSAAEGLDAGVEDIDGSLLAVSGLAAVGKPNPPFAG